VANYPWDGNRERRSGAYTAAPDDRTFRLLATSYASQHVAMRSSREFPGGITNGAEWYILYGGMQDYMYLAGGDLEITVEVSYDKYPPARDLDRYWNDNRASLFNYVRQAARLGVRGQLIPSGDKCTIRAARLGTDLKFAEIDHAVSPDGSGHYWRLLGPGRYRLTANCPGKNNATTTVDVPLNQASQVVADFKW